MSANERAAQAALEGRLTVGHIVAMALEAGEYDARQRVNERVCCLCGRPDANYEAWGHFYCDRCNDSDSPACASDHKTAEPAADWAGMEDLVDPPIDIYTLPVVKQLTDIIVAAIHREVCEPYQNWDHPAGGAHLPCEYNLRYGAEVYVFMGQPSVER